MEIEQNKHLYNKFIRNDIATFSKDVDVLRSLIRYQNCNRLVNESVAEHSFYVAVFVLKLREYYDFNLEVALKTALIHDIPEARISDIPHNIKIANPEVAAALEKAEEKVTIDMLSEEANLLLKSFNHGDTVEGKICQLADVLSVVLYANDEIKCGNRIFNYIAIKAIARCKQIVASLEAHLNNNYTQEQIMNKINQIVNIY